MGNRMLKAMGWKEGTGLGKESQGITAPIKGELRSERAGLGAEPSGDLAVNPGDSYRTCELISALSPSLSLPLSPTPASPSC